MSGTTVTMPLRAELGDIAEVQGRVAKVNDGSANFDLVGVRPQPPSLDAAIAALDASGDLYLEQAADWLRQSQGPQK